MAEAVRAGDLAQTREVVQIGEVVQMGDLAHGYVLLGGVKFRGCKIQP